MPVRPLLLALAAASAVALVSPAPAAAAPATAPAEYARVLEERAPAYVTVKYLLRIEMGGAGGMEDREQESEVTALVIEPSGLLVVSNTQFEGVAGMMRRMMGARGGNVSATPKDLKVMLGGDDAEGLSARVIARDSELDLCWIRLEAPPEKPLAAVDLAAAKEPKIGERLLSLERMGKFFDRAPVVSETVLGGVTTKPRRLLVPTGGILADLGIPVFDAAGGFVGMSILQTPTAEESDGGGRGGFRNQVPIILPAAEILAATARAKESAGEGAATAEPKPEGAAPAEAPAGSAGKP